MIENNMPPSNTVRLGWFRWMRRAFSWELRTLPVSEHERTSLIQKEIVDEPLHRYAAWRRSVLIVILIPTLLSAILHTIGLVMQGRQELNIIGHILSWSNTLIMWAVPVTAGLALLYWTRLKQSQYILQLGWIVTFILPFLIALVPYQLRLDQVHRVHPDPTAQREIILVNLLHGLHVTLILLPTALAILPGVVRACLRIKTLLPATILPGWFLMMAPPFYLLLMVIALIVLTQVAESPMLLAGMVLFIGSPMIYLSRADLFVRPLGTEDAAQIRRVHFWVSMASLAGVATLAYFAFTQEIGGLHLFGIDSQTSLIWLYQNRAMLHLNPGEALARSTSIFSMGDIRFSQVIVQYCGQSLFMTAVFADALVRMSLSIWSQEKRFKETEASTAYDQTMGNLQRVMV